MGDGDGMLHVHRVEVFARERAAFGGFGVVVLETENPVPYRGLRGAGAQGGLDVRDRAEVAIHFAQVGKARF